MFTQMKEPSGLKSLCHCMMGMRVIVTFVSPPKQAAAKDRAERQAAYKSLAAMIKSSKTALPLDFDYKKEWHTHLDEKYAYSD
ncbi:hypothetical protein ACYULU_15250 [Breznakiellaceae bacterium SP9]